MKFFNRNFIVLNFFRCYKVLGIETSCDDTAVAIVDSNRKILSSKKINDNYAVYNMGGIFPMFFANQHRKHIDKLVIECLEESQVRISDLDAISVTTAPGMVISLKVGVDKALALAKEHYLKLIPVHHMRAHALIARLIEPNLKFPFVALLISGGHSLIVLVKSAEDFKIICQSESGSPGECLDKFARQLGLKPRDSHYASTLEKFAENADKNGFLKYQLRQPAVSITNFNFSHLKSSGLSLIKKIKPTENELPNFCSSLQFAVMSHICKKLDAAFQILSNYNFLTEETNKKLIVSGGVASNAYFIKCIQKLASYYNFTTVVPTKKFCTDNGEMIAWFGIELLTSFSNNVIIPENLPNKITVCSKKDIGTVLIENFLKKDFKKFHARRLHLECMT